MQTLTPPSALRENKVSAQRGARTHDPEIKSLMLYRLSQSGSYEVSTMYFMPGKESLIKWYVEQAHEMCQVKFQG